MRTTGSQERTASCSVSVESIAGRGSAVPGSREAYRACRRCRKRRWTWGAVAADDFYRSGMDEKSQSLPGAWARD